MHPLLDRGRMVGHYQQTDFILAHLSNPADNFRIDLLDGLYFLIDKAGMTCLIRGFNMYYYYIIVFQRFKTADSLRRVIVVRTVGNAGICRSAISASKPRPRSRSTPVVTAARFP